MLAGLYKRSLAQETEPSPPLPHQLDWHSALAPKPRATFPASTAPDAEVAAAAATQYENWWTTVYRLDYDGNADITAALPGRSWREPERRLTTHPALDFQPRLNPEATQVVFVSERDGNLELYKINVDGSGLTRLTNREGTDAMPTWSPDGQQIAFFSERSGSAQLYTMSANGDDVQALTGEHNNIWVDWSTANNRLAWIQVRDDGRFLMTANADGSSQRTIAGPLAFAQHPRWSPDGEHLALDYDANGDFANDIVAMNADGSDPRTLLTGTFEGTDLGDVIYDLWLTSWTPDGGRLLYNSYYYYSTGRQFELDEVFAQETYFPEGGGAPTEVSDLYAIGTDVRNADPYPPRSSLDALPPFSRSNELLLYLRGSDRGPAEIFRYSLESRQASGEWTPLQEVALSTADYEERGEPLDGTVVVEVGGTPGQQTHYRVRAVDGGGNEEAWPERAQALTTPYRWQVEGQVTDNRGYPLAGRPVGSPLALNEGARTDNRGRYTLYAPEAGRTQVESTPIASTSIEVVGDTHVNLYPQPEDAAIVFDQPLVLSAPCEGLCPSQTPPLVCKTTECLSAERTWPAGSARGTIITVDGTGLLHLLYASDGEIRYASRGADGTWSEVEVVAREMAGAPAELGVAGDGTVHAMWSVYSSGQKNYHAERIAAGGWQTQAVADGSAPRLALDARGNPHLLYLCSVGKCDGNLFYIRRNADGAWSAPVQWATDLGRDDHAIASTPDGGIHAVWARHAPDSLWDGRQSFYYRERTGSGRWSPTQVIREAAGSASQLKLIGTPDSTLHLLWEQYAAGRTVVAHKERKQNDIWRSPNFYRLPDSLPGAWGYRPFALPDGDLYILLHLDQYADDGSSYLAQMQRPRGAAGFTVGEQAIPTDEIAGAQSYAVDPGGRLHFITGYGDAERRYFNSDLAATSQTISKTALLEISTALHRPTLSFFYTLRGASGSATTVEVAIDDGIESTTVFSTTSDGINALGWADLDPWSGQTVTATFALNQAAEATPASLALSDVALASWRTARLETVEPQQIGVEGAVLTLRGENFLEGLQASLRNVWTGQRTVLAVRLIDGQTLEADVPAGLSPGLYQLGATNSGGEPFELMEALQIGERLLLPIVTD